MAIVYNSGDPAGQAIAAELAAVVAAIAALNPSVEGAAKAAQVYGAKRAALELELVQHALASGRLAPASVLANCSLD